MDRYRKARRLKKHCGVGRKGRRMFHTMLSLVEVGASTKRAIECAKQIHSGKGAKK